MIQQDVTGGQRSNPSNQNPIKPKKALSSQSKVPKSPTKVQNKRCCTRPRGLTVEMPIAHTNIKCASWECQSTTATHIVAVENIKCTSLAFAPPWISCNSCSGQLACLISLHPSEHVNLRPSCGGNNRYRGKTWCFPRECFTSHWQSFKGRFAPAQLYTKKANKNTRTLQKP